MGQSRMSVVKRQRELRKAEKAAQKRAKRHGIPDPVFTEPKPKVRLSDQNESTDSPEETKESESDQQK